ncbi:hypothetical protein PG995_009703 [Apiospora arundinis]
MGESNYEEVGESSKRGGFASVRRVKRLADGKVLACKRIAFETRIYETRQNFRRRVEREIHLLNKVDHPNIVQYFEADWPDESTAMVYMEYITGGNLSEYIEANSREPDWPSEEQGWSFVYQLSAALAYCHYGLYRVQGARKWRNVVVEEWTQILHRDIKPKNVLVQHTTAGQVQYKLCDFGLSVLQCPTDEASISYCGTSGYIAPEITMNHTNWSAKADVYSFGCTLFYLYEKRTPPNSQYSTCSTMDSTRESLLNAPPSIQAISDACLCPVPERRPESKDLFETASNHVNASVVALATGRESRILQSNRVSVAALVDGHEHNVTSQVDKTVTTPDGRRELNIPNRVDETPRDLAPFISYYEPVYQDPNRVSSSGVYSTTDSDQTNTPAPQALHAPSGFLFANYITRRPMTLAIRSSVETSFPTKENGYVVEDEEAIGFGDNRRIFKAERSGFSWFWNCALVDRDGNRLFALERPSQRPKLLNGKESFSGRDAAKNEIFEIGCSKYPADHIKVYPEKLGPYMKAVCRFLNARGGQESLAVDVFRWNKRDMYIKDEKTGRYIALASMYFTGTGYIDGCRLLLEPGVDMVLVVAIGLVILRLNRC